MDYEPLTQDAHFPSMCSLRLRGWRQISDGVLSWWRVTTSDAYLKSPVSRRDVRARLLPIFWVGSAAFNLLFPLENQQATMVLDVVTSVGVVTASCLETLWSDTLYCVMLFVYFAGWKLFNPSIDPQVYDIIITNSLFAIHTLHNMVFLVANSLLNAFLAPDRLYTLPHCFLMLSLNANMEQRIAQQAVELEQERQATRYLLEGASDGWCTLSTTDGTIASSNARLGANFGRSNLAGASLANFVCGADVHRINEVCGLAGTGAVLTPFLVTCQTDLCDFDAKVIPYAGCAETVKVCIQVQGERRFHSRPRPAPTQGTNDAPSEFALSATTISNPSAFQPQVRRRTYAERAAQTDATPGQAKPPVIPPSLLARDERSESASLGGSEGSASSARGRRHRRRRPLITFSNRPLLPEFSVTSADVMERSLQWTLMHWSIPRPKPKNMCCEYHAACQILCTLANKLMTTTPCQPGWRPCDGWQCPRCKLVHSDLSNECDLCWMQRPGSDSDQSSSSHESVDVPARGEPLSL